MRAKLAPRILTSRNALVDHQYHLWMSQAYQGKTGAFASVWRRTIA